MSILLKMCTLFFLGGRGFVFFLFKDVQLEGEIDVSEFLHEMLSNCRKFH